MRRKKSIERKKKSHHKG